MFSIYCPSATSDAKYTVFEILYFKFLKTVLAMLKVLFKYVSLVRYFPIQVTNKKDD